MDLERMLDRCRREPWSLDEVRWDHPVRAMSREAELSIVQCFTDMVGIEQLAAALFAEQARRETDPTLRRIFEAFVADELRHAEAARRLAARFDVHGLRRYAQRPALTRFAESFVEAVRHLPPDIVGAYVLVGEIILDVALLRSLDDAIDDPVAHEVMKLVNRDESRHLAVDFYLFDYHASEAYAQRAARDPRRSMGQPLAGALSLGRVMLHARPFFREVFFEPMARVDPSGRRLKEAVKRLQLLIQRPGAARRPFVRFIRALFSAYQRPLARALVGPAVVRLVGIEPELLRTLYTEIELRRAVAMTLDELTEDALAAKRAA
jgi:para-aminobenzoate N-oxygenase AurF